MRLVFHVRSEKAMLYFAFTNAYISPLAVV